MDLPTCPACGQSVLDEDAVECPFCGAAMDGSSGSKNPAGKAAVSDDKPQAKAKSDSEAKKAVDNDDPFAIEKPKTPRKVIPCAPRPMKSRTQKVICPMCDKPGFIPPAAMGRAVKCANKECLVPIFTAGEVAQKAKGTPAPTRVSDQEVPSKTVREPGRKNPLMLWGIVGGVLLAGTVAGLFLLKDDGAAENALNQPIDLSKFTTADDEDPDETTTETPDTVEDQTELQESPRVLAERLADRMVSTARQSGNRDKAFSRSLTAGTYLRLGKTEEANREFAQLTRVSGSGARRTEYYKIAPLVEHYFRLKAAGDESAADFLKQAVDLKEELPRTGSQAFDAAIRLSAAMVVDGRTSDARTLVEGLQKDQTIVAQIDMIRTAAWASTARRMWMADLEAFSPMTVQQWHEPLPTAVAVWLAARGEIDAAVEWISGIDNTLTLSDTAAAVANVLRQRASSVATKQKLMAIVEDAYAAVSFRVAAELSSSATDEFWTQAKQKFGTIPVGVPRTLPGFQEIINAQSTNTEPDVLRLQAFADFASAAVRMNDAESATLSLAAMGPSGLATVPTAADLRQASFELAHAEDDVKKRLKEELRLSDSRMRSRFLAYRRSVDRMSKAAEERRLQLIFGLGRVAENAGLETVQAAIDSNEPLKKEVQLDLMKDWISICATAHSDTLQVLQTDPKNFLPFTRTEAPPEVELMSPLSAFWTRYKQTGSFQTARQLEQGNVLQGFRAATLGYLAQKRFSQPDVSTETLLTLGAIKNPLWRENCIEIASWAMTRNGQFQVVEESLREVAASPSQKIVAYFGAVRALEL